MKKFAFIIIVLLNFFACNYIPDNNLKTKTIKHYDLNRYTGIWYEVARYNHRVERGLTGVSATYKINGDGSIKVINQGFKDSLNGKKSYIEGYAVIPDNNNMGFLKVYFSKWFGAPYLILELDTINYQYALIGSTFRNYLWVLSREKQMPAEHYNICINKAKNLGYDTSKLLKVVQ